jgi:hypothetical protein
MIVRLPIDPSPLPPEPSPIPIPAPRAFDEFVQPLTVHDPASRLRIVTFEPDPQSTPADVAEVDVRVTRPVAMNIVLLPETLC